MAKKAKKSAVKKTSSKTKSKNASHGKTTSKVKVKAKATKAKAKKVSATSPAATGSKLANTGLRVSEYKLFTEDSVRSLEDQVNYHIKKCWSPVGGVVLQGASTFTQTMVRHDI